MLGYEHFVLGRLRCISLVRTWPRPRLTMSCWLYPHDVIVDSFRWKIWNSLRCSSKKRLEVAPAVHVCDSHSSVGLCRLRRSKVKAVVHNGVNNQQMERKETEKRAVSSSSRSSAACYLMRSHLRPYVICNPTSSTSSTDYDFICSLVSGLVKSTTSSTSSVQVTWDMLRARLDVSVRVWQDHHCDSFPKEPGQSPRKIRTFATANVSGTNSFRCSLHSTAVDIKILPTREQGGKAYESAKLKQGFVFLNNWQHFCLREESVRSGADVTFPLRRRYKKI